MVAQSRTAWVRVCRCGGVVSRLANDKWRASERRIGAKSEWNVTWPPTGDGGRHASKEDK